MDKKEIDRIKKEAIRENAIKAGKASNKVLTKEQRIINGRKGAEIRWENWREANL